MGHGTSSSSHCIRAMQVKAIAYSQNHVIMINFRLRILQLRVHGMNYQCDCLNHQPVWSTVDSTYVRQCVNIPKYLLYRNAPYWSVCVRYWEHDNINIFWMYFQQILSLDVAFHHCREQMYHPLPEHHGSCQWTAFLLVHSIQCKWHQSYTYTHYIYLRKNEIIIDGGMDSACMSR